MIKDKILYFPYETDTSTEPKIKALIMNYGLESFGVYLIILEQLAKSKTFCLKLSDIDREILAATCYSTSEKFNSILSYLIKIDLLKTNQDETIFSPKLNELLIPILEKRERERKRIESLRAKREKAEKEMYTVQDEMYTVQDEMYPVQNDKGEVEVEERRKEEELEKNFFLVGRGKHTHEQKNQNQDQPTTDQKKYINSAIYEEIQEELQKTDTKDEEEYKRKKVAQKKEKEFTQQDEQGDGKFAIKGESEVSSRDDSRNAKIDPIMQEIEKEVYINSLFSHDFAPHWQNWIEHLENRGISTPLQVQIAQQAEHIKNANEKNISIEKLEKMLIMEIASTIQNQKKTSKNLVALNPLFHLKKINDNERTNQNRKYKSKYNS